MTLVELLVVLAILLPVLTVVFAFCSLGEQISARSNASIEAQENGRIALEEAVNELQYAHRVTVEPSGKTITYYKLVEGIMKRYQLYLGGQQLLLNLPEGTAVPLAACIKDVVFEPRRVLLPGEAVEITLTAVHQEQAVTLRSRVSPRNLWRE